MTHVGGQRRWLRLAVAQGITAPLVYLGVAVVGGALTPGYSHFDQAVSELTMAGAANRPGLDIALGVMEVLTIGFGIGFFVLVRDVNRKLAASAALMVAIGTVGLGFACFPMDPIGSPMTPAGRMHLILVAVSALGAIASVLLSGLGWWRVADARRLALLSFAALAVILVSGGVSGIAVPNGWPGIGLWERVNIAAFGLWQIATALFLLRNGGGLRAGARLTPR